jgi:23S rRNA (cytidine1920-2'-O)/16S rRNA (cytidine1409-2'-O)-methyltransferase
VTDAARPYVSRGGQKLEAALREFSIDPSGMIVADFGSHVGGFVDCLLRHGAARVYAVEPGYGVLDFRLRRDPRVVVCERRNAMHFRSPEPCDLVTIDVGWTPQRLILSAAAACLKPGGSIVSLIKPHYESPKGLLRQGVLPADHIAGVLEACARDVAGLRLDRVAELRSPLEGHGGNAEFLWLIRPAAS